MNLVDIDIIFNSTRPNTTKHIYKRFVTSHVPKCSRYLKKVEELFEASCIFHEVENLEQIFIDYKNGNIVNEKGKVLDVSGGKDKENQDVIVWNLHNGLNQQWDIVYSDLPEPPIGF